MLKWVKDPWRIREVMKLLRDVDNNLFNKDDKKAEGLISDHFVWNEGRKVNEKEERGENEEVEKGTQEEMVTKVEIALSRTHNSSASGPDSIRYRFNKGIKDTILVEKMLEEVAKNLIKGIFPREWQNSKLVMIPKLGKDHEKTKGWRPINLINCIGKLGEKVVADVFQGWALLYKHQFGLVKGRYYG